MPDTKIRRALIAVYDKTGVAEFAKTLVEEFGIEIISTGGTAKHLKEAGIPVTLVEEVTGFPEMLDGRVKTLHPKIHAAILADRDNPEHMRQLAQQGIKPIDMVVVNLYPFEKTVADPNCTFEQAIEMIDIGGPCLLRAAAKNHRHVLIVTEPSRYRGVVHYLRESSSYDEASLRQSWVERAWGVFWCTSSYDGRVASWLAASQQAGRFGMDLLPLHLEGGGSPELRYGENPHQVGKAFEFGPTDWSAYVGCRLRHVEEVPKGPTPSYNNLADADAALMLCEELTRAGPSILWDRSPDRPHKAGLQRVVVFIKHTNACGAAEACDAIDAYRKAYLGDPNAAMGGILAVNFEVTPEFAETVMETYQRWGKAAGAGGFFVEVWIAPSFEEKAVEIIRTKKDWGKRVRLLEVAGMGEPPDPEAKVYRSIAGGMLVQTPDIVGLNEEQWKVVTQRQPTPAEMNDLRLAWLVCKHTKSNAITICKDGMLIGNGAGQMSRVMSCRIATWLAKENGHADKLAGAVAASDAFFPFRDGPGILMEAGVTAIIQPGGSKRDEDTIAACNDRGVAMIFTGTRHFKH